MAENGTILVYDGSFNGYLSAIHIAFDQQLQVAGIRREQEFQKTLFAEVLPVVNNMAIARRVWSVIEQRNHQAVRNIYFAFLSEQKGVEELLYRYIKILFAKPGQLEPGSYENLRDKVELLAHMVSQEKKQMETTLQFQHTPGQVDMALVCPRFNILPLITKHFRTRQPHGSWILYDKRRNYGLYYHHHQMELLQLSAAETTMLTQRSAMAIQGPLSHHRGTAAGKPTIPVKHNYTLSQKGLSQESMLQGSSAA